MTRPTVALNGVVRAGVARIVPCSQMGTLVEGIETRTCMGLRTRVHDQVERGKRLTSSKRNRWAGKQRHMQAFGNSLA